MTNQRRPSHSVAWLSEDNPPLHRPDAMADVPARPTVMAEDIGSGSFEVLNIRPGMSLARGAHNFLPERSGQIIPVAETTISLTEPAIAIQSAASGRAIVKDAETKKSLLLSEGSAVFHRFDEIQFSREHDASQSNDLYFLFLTETDLYGMLGEGVARKLLAALNLHDMPAAQTFNTPFHISQPLHLGGATRMSGDLGKVFLEGRVLEYLSLLSSWVLGQPEFSSSSRRTMLIHQLHEELLNLENETPNLNSLARRYGLSAKTLNTEFKNEFGRSIFAYVKDVRLDQAHTALEQTDTPIKVIAARVGYAHPSNFMLAFKKKFGYPPGHLRR